MYGTVRCCREGLEHTCPNTSPLKRHGGESHTTLKPMASHIQQGVGNLRIVCIQRVAKNHQKERKANAKCVENGLLLLVQDVFPPHLRVRVRVRAGLRIIKVQGTFANNVYVRPHKLIMIASRR